MYAFTLCGYQVRRRFKPNRSTRGAITTLDLKITDFREKLSSNRYRNSTESSIEASEILGEIKFMYISGLLNGMDYRRIVNRLTGQSFDDLDYDDGEDTRVEPVSYSKAPDYFATF